MFSRGRPGERSITGEEYSGGAAVSPRADDCNAMSVVGAPGTSTGRIDRAGVVRAHTLGLSMAYLHVEWVRPSGTALVDSLLAAPQAGGGAS